MDRPRSAGIGVTGALACLAGWRSRACGYGQAMVEPDASVPVVVARVAAEAIRPLRHAVLRPGLPADSACFPGDEATGTIHLAARSGGQVVGCASFMRSEFAGEPAWQLRGMATAPEWRGRGVGARLLVHADALLADEPIRLLWCNARVIAIGFYERQGWSVVSEEFDIPTAGPHRRMTRRR